MVMKKNALDNKGALNYSYVPTAMEDWVPMSISLPNDGRNFRNGYILFRFRYHPGVGADGYSSGNNFYIDRISFNKYTAGIEEHKSASGGVVLAPNPTSGRADVVITDQAGNIARVVSALKRVAPRAEALGVKLAFETHDSWTKAANLRAVIDGVGSPMLGACWDVANCYHTEPLAQSFVAIRNHIFHVHLKDTKRIDGKIKNVLPGECEVDLAHAVRLLRVINYTGYLSFEWEKKWDATLAEPEVAFPRYISHCRALLNAQS